MTPAEIESKVKTIMAEKLDVNIANIHLDSRLVDNLGMDSFGSIEMVFELEEAFKLKIPDEDIVKAMVEQNEEIRSINGSDVETTVKSN